jgi:hypothetical protein
MADNVGYTPGSGAIISTDDIAGAHHQRVKLTLGNDGTDDGTVSATNPIPVTAYSSLPITVPNGELIECLEAIRMGIHSLIRTSGQVLPDTVGRQRVVIESAPVTLTGVSTVTTVTTVSTVTACTTVGTLTNQSQIGGIQATDQIPALMRIAADSLRRNISVTE